MGRQSAAARTPRHQQFCTLPTLVRLITKQTEHLPSNLF